MTFSENQPSTPSSSNRFTRLRELLITSPKSRGLRTLQEQIQTNRPRNTMLALMLHACSRLERGETLSNFETKMLDSVRSHNNDEDLKEYGRIYQEMTTERRAALFPGRLATMAVEQSYTEADFNEDLEIIIPELMSQPNVRTINVNDLPPDASLDCDDEAFRQAISQYGHGIVIYSSSAEKNQLTSTEPKSYSIKMTRFKSEKSSAEWSRDELYFSVGGASDLGFKTTYTSEEFGGVSQGDIISFPSNAFAFKGKYSQSIAIDIEIWEKDQGTGWKAVAASVTEVANQCVEAAANDTSRRGGGLYALAAIVGFILAGIFGMMEDDFMCQRTIIFEEECLQYFAGKEDWWWFENKNDSGAAIISVYLKLGFTELSIKNDIDAVVNWGNGIAYFFKGDKYVRYNIEQDLEEAGFPKLISKGFPGLGDFANGIDAAVNWGNGIAYFFKGNKYIRYNIGQDRADPSSPKLISDGFKNLGDFANGIDAVVTWGNGIAYFFKGNKYIRYNIKRDQVETDYYDYPKLISESFPGLGDFANGIDAVVNWGNEIAYFFKGNKYIRYNIEQDRAEAGYPQLITNGFR